MRTYKDRVTTVESSKNVLDSFSDSSATALDTLMQEEQGDISAWSRTDGGSDTSFTTSTDTRNSSKAWGISGNLNLKFLTIGGGYGKSMTDSSTTSGGMSSTHDYNETAARQHNVNVLASALNKHVHQTNAVRQIDINNSTSDTTRSGEENVTVRTLKNVNLNNVLNLTARQLLQEYTVLTYLSGLKFAYTNGYPESYTIVDLASLPNMLLDILDDSDPTLMDTVLCKLLSPYCNVMDWEGNMQQFVENYTLPNNTDCLGLSCTLPLTTSVFRLNAAGFSKYHDGVIDVDVPGILLNVQKQTLQTSSLIVDALLGRGDALDCFNQKSQDAQNINDYVAAMQAMQRLTDSIQTTANDQLLTDQRLAMGDQQISVIEGIADANDKATLFKKVYGDCCDVPQSCGGCGCADTPPAP